MFAQGIFNFFNDYLRSVDTNYLEIGVYNGDGCYRLAQNHPSKTIYAIDPFIEDGCTWMHSHVGTGDPLTSQRRSALNYFRQVTNIQHFDQTSESFLQQLTQEQIHTMRVRSVFIDGDHSYRGAANDLQLALRLIGAASGVIALDDINMEGVNTAVREFEQNWASRIQAVDQLARVHNCRIYSIGAAL